MRRWLLSLLAVPLEPGRLIQRRRESRLRIRLRLIRGHPEGSSRVHLVSNPAVQLTRGTAVRLPSTLAIRLAGRYIAVRCEALPPYVSPEGSSPCDCSALPPYVSLGASSPCGWSWEKFCGLGSAS